MMVFVILARALEIYSYIVLISVVLSWIQLDPRNPFVSAIRQITEPPMELIRRALPFVVIGGLDLSPIVLLLGCQLLSNGLMRLAVSV